jgi:hypothetical protein
MQIVQEKKSFLREEQKNSQESLHIKQKIKKEIKRFDISALLKLLRYLGYRVTDIAFQSNPILASASSLCEDIIFSETSRVPLVIILNIGFLSAHSPLPSFFRKKMDTGSIDPILFGRFLSFFDHFVIRNILSMCIPEDNSWFFPDWTLARRQYLSLVALTSASSLSHLIQICFPELKAEVVKMQRTLEASSLSATLGNTYIGPDSFLGKNRQFTIPSFKIILTAEKMDTEDLLSWPLEVKRRIQELIVPLLLKMETFITLILTVKKCEKSAELAPTSYLGYSKIGKDLLPFHLMLFSDYIKKWH